MHLYGVVMGILNAALRLMRLTHIEAQALLYGLTARFDELAGRAAATPLEHMSNYAPMTDILGARPRPRPPVHELNGAARSPSPLQPDLSGGSAQ